MCRFVFNRKITGNAPRKKEINVSKVKGIKLWIKGRTIWKMPILASAAKRRWASTFLTLQLAPYPRREKYSLSKEKIWFTKSEKSIWFIGWLAPSPEPEMEDISLPTPPTSWSFLLENRYNFYFVQLLSKHSKLKTLPAPYPTNTYICHIILCKIFWKKSTPGALTS